MRTLRFSRIGFSALFGIVALSLCLAQTTERAQSSARVETGYDGPMNKVLVKDYDPRPAPGIQLRCLVTASLRAESGAQALQGLHHLRRSLELIVPPLRHAFIPQRHFDIRFDAVPFQTPTLPRHMPQPEESKSIQMEA
jgi:hypothetical protein